MQKSPGRRLRETLASLHDQVLGTNGHPADRSTIIDNWFEHYDKLGDAARKAFIDSVVLNTTNSATVETVDSDDSS